MWVGLLAGVVLESPVVGVFALLAVVILLRFSRPLRVLFGLGLSGYWASVGYELAWGFQGVSLGVVVGAGAFAVATYLHRPMLVPLFDALRRSDQARGGRVSSESRERQSDARAGFGDPIRSWAEDPYASFCCTNSWDAFCVHEAQNLCTAINLQGSNPQGSSGGQACGSNGTCIAACGPCQ